MNQGVVRSKIIVSEASIQKYDNIPDSIMVNGTILKIPNSKNGNNYKIVWIASHLNNFNIDENDLKLTIEKSKTNSNNLKEAHGAYYNDHST